MSSTPAHRFAQDPAQGPARRPSQLEPTRPAVQADQAGTSPARPSSRLQNGYAVLSTPRPPRRRTSDPWSLARRLTDRDRLILRAVARFRVLTTDQLAALYFPSGERARVRLVTLHRLEVLERFEPPARPGMSRPFHYVLGRQGAAVLAAEAGNNPEVAARRWRPDRGLALGRSQRLGHLVGINNLYCTLTLQARPRGARLDWMTEAETARWVGEIVRPDASLTWTDRTGTVECFVEYDRGTETLGRLARKLDSYARLETERGAAAWVLLAFTSGSREEAVRRALAGTGVPVATVTATIRADELGWRPLHSPAVTDLAGLSRVPLPPEAAARAATPSDRAWRFQRSRQPTDDKEPPLDHTPTQ